MTSTGVFIIFFSYQKKSVGKKQFVVQKSRHLHLSALFEVGSIYLEISITEPPFSDTTKFLRHDEKRESWLVSFSWWARRGESGSFWAIFTTLVFRSSAINIETLWQEQKCTCSNLLKKNCRTVEGPFRKTKNSLKSIWLGKLFQKLPISLFFICQN